MKQPTTPPAPRPKRTKPKPRTVKQCREDYHAAWVAFEIAKAADTEPF